MVTRWEELLVEKLQWKWFVESVLKHPRMRRVVRLFWESDARRHVSIV